MGEFWRAGVRLAKGEGYATSYVLLLPGGVCALWMLLAILTQATKPSYVDPGGIDEEELREAAARVCGQAWVMISDIFNEREHGTPWHSDFKFLSPSSKETKHIP